MNAASPIPGHSSGSSKSSTASPHSAGAGSKALPTPAAHARKFRATLLDWLFTVAYEDEVEDICVERAIRWMDCALSSSPVLLHDLQALGLAALWAAVKMDEVESKYGAVDDRCIQPFYLTPVIPPTPSPTQVGP